MTHTAVAIRRLSGWQGDAYLFSLSEPMNGQSQVVVSAKMPDEETMAMDRMIALFEQIFDHRVAPEGEVGDPEILFFKYEESEDEDTPDWDGILYEGADGPAYGIRGTLNHEEAFAKYGYAVDWNGVKDEDGA